MKLRLGFFHTPKGLYPGYKVIKNQRKVVISGADDIPRDLHFYCVFLYTLPITWYCLARYGFYEGSAILLPFYLIAYAFKFGWRFKLTIDKTGMALQKVYFIIPYRSKKVPPNTRFEPYESLDDLAPQGITVRDEYDTKYLFGPDGESANLLLNDLNEILQQK